MLTTMEEKEQMIGEIQSTSFSVKVFNTHFVFCAMGQETSTLPKALNFMVQNLIYSEGFACIQGQYHKVTDPYNGSIIITLPHEVTLPKSGKVLNSSLEVDEYICAFGWTDDLQMGVAGVNAPKGTNWFNTMMFLGKK